MYRIIIFITLLSFPAYAANKKVELKPMDMNIAAEENLLVEDTSVPQLDFGYDKPKKVEKMLELSPEFKYLDDADPTKTMKGEQDKEFKMKLKMGF